MSELDKNRKENFIKNIFNNQVLITCTDKIKLENVKLNSYKVNNGYIIR